MTCIVTVRYTIKQNVANKSYLLSSGTHVVLRTEAKIFSVTVFIYSCQLQQRSVKCKDTCNIHLPTLLPATIDFTLFTNVSFT